MMTGPSKTACDNCGINYSKVLKDALIAKLQQVQM